MTHTAVHSTRTAIHATSTAMHATKLLCSLQVNFLQHVFCQVVCGFGVALAQLPHDATVQIDLYKRAILFKRTFQILCVFL